MIVVELWIMFVFIMGHVHVLVGSLALIMLSMLLGPYC